MQSTNIKRADTLAVFYEMLNAAGINFNIIFSLCNVAKGIKNSTRQNYLLDLGFSLMKSFLKE